MMIDPDDELERRTDRADGLCQGYMERGMELEAAVFRAAGVLRLIEAIERKHVDLTQAEVRWRAEREYDRRAALAERCMQGEAFREPIRIQQQPGGMTLSQGPFCVYVSASALPRVLSRLGRQATSEHLREKEYRRRRGDPAQYHPRRP